MYAESRRSFEEIALKFLELKNDEALKDFLIYKLDTFKPGDVIQITLLVVWLTEILMKQMAEKRDAEDSLEEYDTLKCEFQNLISQNKIVVSN